MGLKGAGGVVGPAWQPGATRFWREGRQRSGSPSCRLLASLAAPRWVPYAFLPSRPKAQTTGFHTTTTPLLLVQGFSAEADEMKPKSSWGVVGPLLGQEGRENQSGGATGAAAERQRGKGDGVTVVPRD